MDTCFIINSSSTDLLFVQCVRSEVSTILIFCQSLHAAGNVSLDVNKLYSSKNPVAIDTALIVTTEKCSLSVIPRKKLRQISEWINCERDVTGPKKKDGVRLMRGYHRRNSFWNQQRSRWTLDMAKKNDFTFAPHARWWYTSYRISRWHHIWLG